MVAAIGFEPMTCRVWTGRYNQLSYAAIQFVLCCGECLAHSAQREVASPNRFQIDVVTSIARFDLACGCGGRIWTNDLRVMSPTSYQLLYPAIFNACLWYDKSKKLSSVCKNKFRKPSNICKKSLKSASKSKKIRVVEDVGILWKIDILIFTSGFDSAKKNEFYPHKAPCFLWRAASRFFCKNGAKTILIIWFMSQKCLRAPPRACIIGVLLI